MCHGSADHKSTRGTIEELASWFWPELEADVSNFVTNCKLCRKEKKRMSDIEPPRKCAEKPDCSDSSPKGGPKEVMLKVAKQQQSARSLWPNFQINDALTEGAVFTQRALMAQSC